MILKSYDDIEVIHKDNLTRNSAVTSKYAVKEDYLPALPLYNDIIARYNRSEVHYRNAYEATFVLRFWRDDFTTEDYLGRTITLSNDIPKFTDNSTALVSPITAIYGDMLNNRYIRDYDSNKLFCSGLLLGNNVELKLMWHFQSGFNMCVYIKIRNDIRRLRFHNHSSYITDSADIVNNENDILQPFEYEEYFTRDDLITGNVILLDPWVGGRFLDASTSFIFAEDLNRKPELYEVSVFFNPETINRNNINNIGNTLNEIDYGDKNKLQDGAKALVTIRRLI